MNTKEGVEKGIFTRRLNFLLRAKDTQNEYMKEQKEGMPASLIYRNLIFPKFRISKSTYYEHLSTNIVQELRKMGVEPEKVLGK